jgi:hypothetical protein
VRRTKRPATRRGRGKRPRRGRRSALGFRREPKRISSPRPQPALYPLSTCFCVELAPQNVCCFIYQLNTKSILTSQTHRAGRQAGAIKPVRRAGWEWAAGLLQQQRATRAECMCASARKSIFSRSLLQGFPQSCLPHAARRVAAHRSATQRLGKRALCHSSSLSIQFTVSNTFTSCDSGLCF